MAIILWDKYEAAILLEAVLRIENKEESKNDAIERVSRQLRSMANNRGLSIDDTYRNTNGISMQMTAMKATAFDIDCKMKSHSKVFCEVVELYYTNKSEYNAILNQAHHWIDYSKEEQHMTSEDTYTVRSNRDAFSSWLQIKQIKKPAPNLIMMAIDEVSEYATKHNVSKVSVWNISDEEKFNALRIKMQAMRLFRLSHKNAATIFDMCWKHYMAFLNDRKNEETGTSRSQDNIHNENNSHSVAVNSERKMDIDSFYEWMTMEANMASSSCRAYASSFRTACDYALSNGLISEKLYEIADDEVLKEQTAKVMQNIDFQNYNAEQHNRFSAALKKYLEYGELQTTDIDMGRYRKPLIKPALIMCTSGTSGNPKGVMLGEKNILTNVGDIAEYFDITEEDTVLIARPLYHCAVLTGEFLLALLKGANIVFSSDSFNPLSLPQPAPRNVRVRNQTRALRVQPDAKSG